MATLSTPPAQMHPTSNQAEFQAWSFEKAMLEAQQHSPSGSSSSEFFDAEERVRITPSVADIKCNMDKHTTSTTFNERYMSSEEALSPTENDGEDSELEAASIYEAETAQAVKFGICDMAVAICIFAVGKAKVVQVPVPSLTSSPSIGSEYDVPERKDSMTAPQLRERNPNRPPLRSQHSTTSIGKDASKRFSHSTSNSIDAYETRRRSLFRSFTNSDPKPPARVDSLNPQAQTPAFLTQDPYAASAPRPQHSRLRNISQKFSRFTVHSGPKTDASEAPTAHSTKLRKLSTAGLRRRSSLHQGSLVTPVTPEAAMPPAPKRKMVARGAAERAPPPEIPPCPYDLGEDGELIINKRVNRRKSLLGLGI